MLKIISKIENVDFKKLIETLDDYEDFQNNDERDSENTNKFLC